MLFTKKLVGCAVETKNQLIKINHAELMHELIIKINCAFVEGKELQVEASTSHTEIKTVKVFHERLGGHSVEISIEADI